MQTSSLVLIVGAGPTGLILGLLADEARSASPDHQQERRARHRVRLVGTEVLKVNWFLTYHVHHRVASRFREGRTFLLGDAAHIHSPVGGQGMNTRVADAVNLAWKLAGVLHGNAADAVLDAIVCHGFKSRRKATTSSRSRR